jgi:hypothetical protein
MRSVGAVAAESYCNAASTTATRTQKAAVTTWMVARDAAKLDGAMPEAAAVTTLVSGSRGSVVTMTKAGVEVDLNRSRPKQSPDQIRLGGPELGRPRPGAAGQEQLGPEVGQIRSSGPVVQRAGSSWAGLAWRGPGVEGWLGVARPGATGMKRSWSGRLKMKAARSKTKVLRGRVGRGRSSRSGDRR